MSARHPMLRVAVAACVAIGLQVATDASADPPKGSRKLYKWTDDKGVIHYTETLPPESTGRERLELDTRGRVRGRKDAALTPEQRRQEAEEAAQRAAEAKTAEEVRRRDKALIHSYTSEAEIDKLRDDALISPMQAIEATQQRLAAAKQRQTDIRQKADALRGQGKVVPGMLVDELNEYGRDVDRLQADLKSKQRELRHTVDKYEVEKRRWRELTAPRQAPGDR